MLNIGRITRERVLEMLRETCGLTPEWSVADIGSGTGISSELFLQYGNRVYGVEPNAAMRAAAEAQFADNPNFISIDGTAEATTLPEAGIDLVVAAQAFHWFDREKARGEFRRILKPDGWVALFWNERRPAARRFWKGMNNCCATMRLDYLQVNHRNIGEAELDGFFTPGWYRSSECEHLQWFDFDGIKGRLLSSSYAPEPGHPNHDPMMATLARLFADHAQDGKVSIAYNTSIYCGQLATNNAAVRIGKATAQDAEMIFALVKDFATSFTPERHAFAESFRHLLQQDDAWLGVARDGEGIVGYLLGFDHHTFYANGRVAWVEEIMVTPEQRRHGIGHLLMDAFEQWAATRGSKLVGLATRRAAPFYQALGYEDLAVFFRKLL